VNACRYCGASSNMALMSDISSLLWGLVATAPMPRVLTVATNLRCQCTRHATMVANSNGSLMPDNPSLLWGASSNCACDTCLQSSNGPLMSKSPSLLWERVATIADVRWTVAVVEASSNRARATCPHNSNGPLMSDSPLLLWVIVAMTRLFQMIRRCYGR
jgi:hypothetical protein